MLIAIGADHGGYELKEKIRTKLDKAHILYGDVGTFSEDSVDYPNIGIKVAEHVRDKEYDLGILVCSTGIGISIAANKVKGIRCALVSDKVSARLTKQHNNSNILALGGKVIDHDLALEIVDIWLEEQFEAGRHQKRIDIITNYEKK